MSLYGRIEHQVGLDLCAENSLGRHTLPRGSAVLLPTYGVSITRTMNLHTRLRTNQVYTSEQYERLEGWAAHAESGAAMEHLWNPTEGAFLSRYTSAVNSEVVWTFLFWFCFTFGNNNRTIKTTSRVASKLATWLQGHTSDLHPQTLGIDFLFLYKAAPLLLLLSKKKKKKKNVNKWNFLFCFLLRGGKLCVLV